jgi:hypothetical protein
MESDAKAELVELERLGTAARRQSHHVSPLLTRIVPLADVAFLGVFALSAWKLPPVAIALWWGACCAVIAWLRLGRRARPRRWWATERGRRDAMAYAALFLAVNAIFFALWFWSRGVAIAVLVTFILASWLRDFAFRQHA